MKLSPVNNVAFGNIYAVHGKKETMDRFGAVMSLCPKSTNIVYKDVTDVFNKMLLRTTRDVVLRSHVQKGEKVGY